MDKVIAGCAACYVMFAGLLYTVAIGMAGTAYQSVAQSQGMALGGDVMLFIAGIALMNARNEYRCR